MKQQKIILSLVFIAFILMLLLTSNIGYAKITPIQDGDILLSPEKANFKVGFSGKAKYIGNGKIDIRFMGPTKATINITGLSAKGDSATAIFTIKNESENIVGKLSETVSNSNNKYFKVTATLSKKTISPKNGEVILKVKVELIKTPIDTQKTHISVGVIAEPNNF